jgi:hypothetical protein
MTFLIQLDLPLRLNKKGCLFETAPEEKKPPEGGFFCLNLDFPD